MTEVGYTQSGMWAEGSTYGPLQSNGIDYLCPQCGGYGKCSGQDCEFCNGVGTIALNDPRIRSNKNRNRKLVL
jgi:DnaJ-class molecular chaperone